MCKALKVCAVVLAAALASSAAEAAPDAVGCPLGRVSAPVVVATPPTSAVRDLCVTADGEIRHYGWKTVDGCRRRVFLASRDGANWALRLAAEGDVGPMVKSPYGDGWLYWRDGADGFLECVRSKIGPGDVAPSVVRYPWKRQELRQLLALKGRRRWVAAFSDVRCENGACYRAALMLSDDDGRTWRGFREIALNPIRNAADFRQRGNLPFEEIDKSVHQTQALELPDGKVLLAYGQNVVSRRMVVFDPDWLCETSRKEDFRHGLENVSNHLYVKSLTGGWKGFAGHCAWNRVPGALLVRDPETDAQTRREVLQLARIRDPRLVSDRQGVVWNFPAARRGRVTLDCRVVGAGFRLTLADHWINPCDETNPARSPFSRVLDDPALRAAGWHAVTVAWDCAAGTAVLSIDGRTVATEALASVPPFGLSYLHLQTLAEETDGAGTLFRSFAMEGGVGSK